MEDDGDRLSDRSGPSPANLYADADAPRPAVRAPGRTRDPITQPWRVSYVRLLGNLEIEVTDEDSGSEIEGVQGSQRGQTRTLPLADVKGFGPLAKAACVALALNLRTGRTPHQLGKAMDPGPGVPSALQSHLSAVRRTGLVVSHRSGIYRIDGLDREQVDALRFEDLHREMYAIGATGRTDRDPELIGKAEEALSLWADDPVSAHPYYRDEVVLRRFAAWLADIQHWYVDALLRRGSAHDIDTAERIVDEIGRRAPAHRGLAELRHRVDDGYRPEQTALVHGPDATGGPARWLDVYTECLHGLVSSIDLRGFSFETLNSSSLAIFTPLYAKPRTQERPRPGHLTGAGRPLLDTVINRTRANLVVGDSGSGKSTLLLHLCAQYLPEGSALVPLFVELGSSHEISEHRLDRQGRLPWQILPELFSSRFADLGVDVSVEDLDGLAKTTPVVWLVDGLNEISKPEIRFALAEAIGVCVHRWPKAQFVVTTTQTAMHGYGVPPGFQQVDVDDFRPEDVDFFLDAFFRDHYPDRSPEECRQRWAPLAVAVRQSAELGALAKNPLLLTAMTVAYLGDGRLPDSRADLLRGAVEWLITKKAPLLRPYVGTRRDVRLVFSELAYQMMARGPVPLGRVGRAWAADGLRHLHCFNREVDEFLDAAVSAGGLLMERGPGDIGMHDAFRAYLAASRIAAKTDDPASGWWSELAPHLDDPEWHAVVALVPGALLLLGGSERVDLFFDSLGASCAGQNLETRAGRVTLGGNILRELRLAGYQPTNTPRWVEAVRSIRQLLDHPAGIPLELRYGATVAYGITGDERFLRAEASWAAMPAGEFWMGAQAEVPGARNFDADAAPWESPVTLVNIVKPFAVKVYPITVHEYAAFVDAGGYGPDGLQFWSAQGRQWRERFDARAPLDWDIQLSVPNAPVSWVSWHECIAYCNWLTEHDDDDVFYRLPYEHEWEYVARRGTSSSQFRWGDRMRGGDDAEANWAGAFLRRKTPVGMFPASTTTDGVADLFGNVEEWCLDAWEDYVERRTGAHDVSDRTSRPLAADAAHESTKRVVRGGSCIRFSRMCRPSYRSRIQEDQRYATVGFRPIRLTGRSTMFTSLRSSYGTASQPRPVDGAGSSARL